MREDSSAIARSIALVLVALVVLVSLSASAAVNAQRASDRIVLRQNGECHPLQPLGDGSRTVGAFYDYRNPYNMNESDPNYSSGYKYSLFGTTELQRNGTSQLFVYNGSDGLSLVFVHGKNYGDSEEDVGGGGTVAMNVSGLPRSGQWVVEDDSYPGQRQLDVSSPTHTRAIWTSKGGRTDGGAFRGLGSADWRRITITARFNERSPAYPSSEWKGPPAENEYTTWIARSGAGKTYGLDMTAPVYITSGSCAGRSAEPGKTASSGPATSNGPQRDVLGSANGTDHSERNGTLYEPIHPSHPMAWTERSVPTVRDGSDRDPRTSRASATDTFRSGGRR